MTKIFFGRNGGVAAAIFVGVALLYSPTVTFQFVNVDDQLYVPGNELVEHGLTREGFRYAFTSVSEGNYIPLTWVSHMAVVEFWGTNPAAHHAVNVLLHALSATLLFLFLTLSTRSHGRSAVVALLFAVHPLRVESVAWVSERKDVLSGVFWMLVLLLYLVYARRPNVLRYAAVWVALGLGLAAKSTLVTLPCVLLLLDFWPLGRVGVGEVGALRRFARLAAEKVPLILLSAGFSVAALVGQSRFGAVASIHGVSLAERFWNALASYAIYLWQTVWPWSLGVLYPYMGARALYAWGGLGLAMVVGLSAAVLVRWRQQPYLAVGWFWFLGALVPVIGVVQVGEQAHADRYTYIPHVGLFLAVVWAAADAFGERQATRLWRAPLAATMVWACVMISLRQERFWRDGLAICGHTLAVTGPNHFAEANYGGALMERLRYEEAEGYLRRAMAIGPITYRDEYNLGATLLYLGRAREAVDHFDSALAIAPDDARSWALRGNALILLKRSQEAVGSLQRAVELGVKLPDTRTNLAIALGMSGQFSASEELFLRILAEAPGDVEAIYNYGLLLVSRGEVGRAATPFQRVIERAPSHAGAQYYLAAALAQQSRPAEALLALGRAIAADPGLRERARVEALFAPIRDLDGFRAIAGAP